MTLDAFLVADSEDMPEAPDEAPSPEDTLPASYGRTVERERDDEVRP